MNQLQLIPLVLTSALLLISLPISAKTIWESYPDYIAISDTGDGINNNHPMDIPTNTIARILSNLNVKNSSYSPNSSLWKSEERTLRLLTDSEIDLLAQKLSKTIKKLSANKKVVFSISDYRSSFLGKKRLHVSGSVFIRNNHLNLILGEAHIDLSTLKTRSGITGNYGRTKNTLSTGDIHNASSKAWELIPFEGASLAYGRKDWLKVDLNMNYSFALNDQNSQQTNDKYLTSEQKELSNKALESRILKLEALKSVPQPSSHIEDQLRRLQKLYESGTLPEEIYLEQVRSILKTL